MFDRHGKGYLDDTERAMRKMDSKNQGYLDLDKVYQIMETLQDEQKKSAQLIEVLQSEQKKAANLKKGICALVAFAILLACANIGTSFAAARLAKDTTIDPLTNSFVNKETGERLAMSTKSSLFTMEPVSDEQRRRLAAGTLNCEDVAGKGKKCFIAGRMRYSQALNFYTTFCPSWSGVYWPKAACPDDSPDHITLQCGTVRTKVLGDASFPNGGPNSFVLDDGSSYVTFPTPVDGYDIEQTVKYPWNNTECVQKLDLIINCLVPAPPSPGGPPPDPNSGPDCDVMGAYPEGALYCEAEIDFCTRPRFTNPPRPETTTITRR